MPSPRTENQTTTTDRGPAPARRGCGAGARAWVGACVAWCLLAMPSGFAVGGMDDGLEPEEPALSPAVEAMLERIRPETDNRPLEAQGLEVEERTGERVPGELVLTNSRGRAVTLGSYFNDDGRPIILAMVYYDCPVACTAVLDRMCASLARLNYEPGTDYQIVAVSFDHTEKSSDAAIKKELALAALDKPLTPEVRAGVAFHTTDAATARMLSDATGFPYRLLPNGEYSHPIAVMILTPDGTISRYIHGFDYPPRRVRLALLEASEGRIGSSIGDMFLAMCFLYDPRSGAYTLQAFRIMQGGAILSALAMVALILTLRIRETMRRKQSLTPAAA